MLVATKYMSINSRKGGDVSALLADVKSITNHMKSCINVGTLNKSSLGKISNMSLKRPDHTQNTSNPPKLQCVVVSKAVIKMSQAFASAIQTHDNRPL